MSTSPRNSPLTNGDDPLDRAMLALARLIARLVAKDLAEAPDVSKEIEDTGFNGDDLRPPDSKRPAASHYATDRLRR